MSNAWLRLYAEMLNDEKVQTLPDRVFKIWVNLLCFVCSCNAEAGVAGNISAVAFALRETPESVASALHILLQRGLIEQDGEQYKIVKWQKRQYKTKTSTERSRRYRERCKAVASGVAVSVAQSVASVAATPTDTDTDTEQSPLTPKGGAPPKAAGLAAADEQSVKKARPGDPAWMPAATSGIILPGGWCDLAEKKNIPDEQIYKSWRKFRENSPQPYQLKRWKSWIDRERVGAA